MKRRKPGPQRPSCRRAIFSGIETLEGRRLMASLNQFGSVLRFDGDRDANTAEVSVQGETLSASLQTGDQTIQREIPLTAISRIEFIGHGGDDRFINDTAIPAFAWGGSGNDHLEGGSGNDQIVGNEGDDTIVMHGGHDRAWGGPGQDFIGGGDGNDLIFGQEQDDALSGGDGNDRLIGGIGNDTIYGEAGNDHVWAGPGNDFVEGGAGRDSLTGHAGNDDMNGGPGRDRIWGNEGNDRLMGGSGPDDVVGNDGHDVLAGNEGTDRLWGSAGHDFISAGSGSDYVFGGSGHDQIFGDAGDDRLYGEAGSDRLFGNQDNDYLDGGDDADMAYGGGGNDRVEGGNGDDLLSGGAGEDTLVGGHHNDRLFGGSAKDLLFGEHGNDELHGNDGPDGLFGGYGNDVLYGGEGSDLLAGESGYDRVYGGSDGRANETWFRGRTADYFHDPTGSDYRNDASWIDGSRAPQAYVGLTKVELDNIASAALQNWKQAGLDTSNMQFEIRVANVYGNALGWTFGNEDGSAVIYIDHNAAGQHWFIDTTPLDNREFGTIINATGTNDSLQAIGKIDLLTAVHHELGHAAGLGSSDFASVMSPGLAAGVRKLPTAQLASDAPGKTSSAFVDPVGWALSDHQLAELAGTNVYAFVFYTYYFIQDYGVTPTIELINVFYNYYREQYENSKPSSNRLHASSIAYTGRTGYGRLQPQTSAYGGFHSVLNTGKNQP